MWPIGLTSSTAQAAGNSRRVTRPVDGCVPGTRDYVRLRVLSIEEADFLDAERIIDRSINVSSVIRRKRHAPPNIFQHAQPCSLPCRAPAHHLRAPRVCSADGCRSGPRRARADRTLRLRPCSAPRSSTGCLRLTGRDPEHLSGQLRKSRRWQGHGVPCDAGDTRATCRYRADTRRARVCRKSAMVGIGLDHAARGAVVLAIDAPFARRGGDPFVFSPRDSLEQVQLIKDLQRAVDVLLARSDVDSARRNSGPAGTAPTLSPCECNRDPINSGLVRASKAGSRSGGAHLQHDRSRRTASGRPPNQSCPPQKCSGHDARADGNGLRSLPDRQR